MRKLDGTSAFSGEYLKRHGVSVNILDRFVMLATSQASNPGLSWPEIAEVAEHVARHWDSVDGQLANYAHFEKAVERRALKFYIQRKTTAIIANRSPERVLADAAKRVNGVLDKLDAAVKAMDAHTFHDLEPQDTDDEHGGPRYK